ncbi:uncharacterized protein N0V89_007839 [Didymosphaeria variabile]|uniref:Uncharacterized protein n=1 Tax=Didymosphaeria variabile TaxID=1932322 RepID=A0A9W8XLL9_9PLEO|nr:uncharacterized protein N0V89_007839 [Didymosphaeria variabile]KAJ4352491.1 hypothetical protein N0V89_007839 [Didymosphaeria variabile]
MAGTPHDSGQSAHPPWDNSAVPGTNRQPAAEGFPEGAGIDDGVAANDNNSSGPQLPGLAPLTRPNPVPGSFRQAPPGPDATALIPVFSPAPGHTIGTSSFQSDEERRYPSFTSQGQASGRLQEHLRPVSADHDRSSVGLTDQRIVADYGDYQAPVTLYEIVPMTTGCYYAQAWLDNNTSDHPPSPTLLSQYGSVQNIEYRFYHSTQGFIHSGNALSLLVLHNATDPWAHTTLQRESTTTIGTYGYHCFEDDWIHWVTFTPSVETWLKTMEKEGYIKKVREWSKDMQPREKRFHKAYWMAANRRELGGLLRRAPVTGATDPNAVDYDLFPGV